MTVPSLALGMGCGCGCGVGWDVIQYAARWLASFFIFEWLLHLCPVFAVVRSGEHEARCEDLCIVIGCVVRCQWALCLSVCLAGLFRGLSPVSLLGVSYLLLLAMWLKFLLIWRFFRLWAMLDGMCVPENMTRCMSNNHSLSQFWRGWHASFNQWIVRSTTTHHHTMHSEPFQPTTHPFIQPCIYGAPFACHRYLYGPLGGRAAPVTNVVLVFGFVSLWHEVEWRLAAWGLLNSVFYAAEVSNTHTHTLRHRTTVVFIAPMGFVCVCFRSRAGGCTGPHGSSRCRGPWRARFLRWRLPETCWLWCP